MKINLNPQFARLGESFFSYIQPTPLLRNPHLAHVHLTLLDELELSLSSAELTKILSGAETIDGYQALASVYMGHQFGIPVPRLGDGRAILIAEHQTSNSETWELQLKGAGQTPYSRMGDGRAVLRSSIREYLVSHAMNKLGIPTTLAAAILHSNDPIYREEIETAAVVLRVSPSFIRFGHCEYFARQKQTDKLEALVQFICKNYFLEIDLSNPDYIILFLEEVVKRTAEMIAHWQSIGFVHGVMNSDNMSILGLTIDYGPFSFMDKFNPEQIFNHSDSEGRYTYAKQPYIGWWNLYRLAEALSSIYLETDNLEQVLGKYSDYYNQKYTTLMATKLGLTEFTEADGEFLDNLLQIMQQEQIDWTYFWRQLSYGLLGQEQLQRDYPSLALSNWFLRLEKCYQQQELSPEARQKLMLSNNPALILRNHLLQVAIERAKIGDYNEISRLFDALSNPFVESDTYREYYQAAPRGVAEIILSCSS